MSEEDDQMNEPQDQPKPDQPRPDFDQVDFGEPEAGVQEVPVGAADVPVVGRPSAPLVKRAVMLGGALLLLVAFFLPWWSVDVNFARIEEDWDEDERLTLAEIGLKNANWYIDHFNAMELATFAKRLIGEVKPYLLEMLEYRRDMKEYGDNDFSRWDKPPRAKPPDGGFLGGKRKRPEEPEPPRSISFSFFGSDITLGSFALATGLVVAAVAAAWWYLPGAAPYVWLGDLAAVVMAAIVVICAALWCILCPGEDIGTGFRQGLSVGPLLALAGSLCVLVPGIMDVLPRLKELRAKPPVGRPIA